MQIRPKLEPFKHCPTGATHSMQPYTAQMTDCPNGIPTMGHDAVSSEPLNKNRRLPGARFQQAGGSFVECRPVIYRPLPTRTAAQHRRSSMGDSDLRLPYCFATTWGATSNNASSEDGARRRSIISASSRPHGAQGQAAFPRARVSSCDDADWKNKSEPRDDICDERGDDDPPRHLVEAFKLHAAVNRHLEQATSILVQEASGKMDGRSKRLYDLLSSASENLATNILRSRPSLLLPREQTADAAAGTADYNKPQTATKRPSSSTRDFPAGRKDRSVSARHEARKGAVVEISAASCNTTDVDGAADEPYRGLYHSECSDVSESDSRPLKKRILSLGVQQGASGSLKSSDTCVTAPKPRRATVTSSSAMSGGSSIKAAAASKCHVCDKEIDQSIVKPYLLCRRICAACCMATVSYRDGQAVKYCQLCSRAHAEADFDPGRKSCRAELEKHAERRRNHRAALRRQKDAASSSAATTAAAPAAVTLKPADLPSSDQDQVMPRASVS